MANRAYGWIGEIGWVIPPGWTWFPGWPKVVIGAAFDPFNKVHIMQWVDLLGIKGVVHYHPTKDEITAAIADDEVVAYVANARCQWPTNELQLFHLSVWSLF